MANESDISLKVSTQYDGAGLTMAAADMAKLEKEAPQAAAAVKRLETAVQQAGVAKKKTADQTEELVEKTAKARSGMVGAGQATMQASRAFQDLQFGVAGVLNNIEGLVMSLGGGAGLAGVLTLVGVAASILIPKLTAAGDESEKTAEKQAKLTEEARKAADAASNEAAMSGVMETALRSQQAEVKALTELYKEWHVAIDTALKLRNEMARQEIAKGDAKAGLEMAEVDDAESRGVITKQEAEKRRAKATGDAEQRRFESAKRARDEAAAGARAKAALLDAEAAQKDTAAGEREEQGAGLLTPAERKAAEEKAKAAQLEADEAFLKGNAARKKIAEWEKAQGPAGVLEWEVELRKEFEAQKEKQIGMAGRDLINADIAVEEGRRSRDYNQRLLDRDAQARARTGVDDRDKLTSDVQAEREAAAKARGAAGSLRTEADMQEGAGRSEAEVYDAQRKTRDIRSGIKVRTMDDAEKEKSNERGKKDANERAETREKLSGRARKEFGDVTGGARDAGANEAGIEALSTAFQQYMAGDESKGAALMQLASQLQNAVPKMKKEIDELRAAIEAMRSGH